jgi:Domain of unknown function (DUF5658)
MKMKTLRLGQLLLYAALSLVDLALTYRLLQRGGGHVYESNPVANAWLSAYGWAGLVAFKLACMALVGSVAVLLWSRRPRAADRLLTFSCTAVALVVLYSCSLVGFFGEGFPTELGIPALAESRPSGFELPLHAQVSHGHTTRLFFRKPGSLSRPRRPLPGEVSGPYPGKLAKVGSPPREVPPR